MKALEYAQKVTICNWDLGICAIGALEYVQLGLWNINLRPYLGNIFSF